MKALILTVLTSLISTVAVAAPAKRAVNLRHLMFKYAYTACINGAKATHADYRGQSVKGALSSSRLTRQYHKACMLQISTDLSTISDNQIANSKTNFVQAVFCGRGIRVAIAEEGKLHLYVNSNTGVLTQRGGGVGQACMFKTQKVGPASLSTKEINKYLGHRA